MIYKIIQPSPQLNSFVRDYLLLHFVFDKGHPVPIKPFPANTQQCLVFYVRGSVTAFDPNSKKSILFPQIAVNGSITSRLDYSISHDCLLLSVNFHPDALSKFLRLPLTDLVDERIDAEAMLGPLAGIAYERMVYSDSYESIVRIAEAFLWKRIQNLKADVHPIDQVARLIASNPIQVKMEEMASHACLSVSQFERRFIQLTGITPKFFSRINRFYSAYQIKDRNPGTDWLSIALQAGYHDYQHLVKDFKQFANTSPKSLLDAQARSPERILGIGCKRR
ncbi:MAG TPA: AraC family transcriptional regulator [Puia sp.]|nr:AraC family transcriptional regulator [Puia sp.]